MRKKVLLIDDSVTIHKIVDLTIDRYSFELLSAYDIDEGLSTSSAEAPALILIDNKLFTHTTEDALMELRSGNPNVGIVLLVGAYEHSETELEHTIVDDYIVKPFNSGTLNQVLTDILAKRGEPVEDSQAPEPTIAVIDGLEAVTDTEDIQDGDGEPTMIDISDDEESAPTTEPALPSLDELPDFSNDDLVDTAESLLTLEEPELAAEESDTIDEIVEEPALDDVAEEPVKDVFAASDEPIADELSPEAL
ncbi:MAG: hypothetical protein LBV04_03015, partial [Deferribacteraceae bacterium]|nr:hypothetical protein [Deferribacteraceae bacterium]